MCKEFDPLRVFHESRNMVFPKKIKRIGDSLGHLVSVILVKLIETSTLGYCVSVAAVHLALVQCNAVQCRAV